jgi:hypothetical protein
MGCGGCYLRRDGFDRPLEQPLYGVSSYVAEWWNTVSNLPFVIIGISRLVQMHLMALRPPTLMFVLYALYTCAGVFSAIHHAAPATRRRRTILLDWTPISAQLIILTCTSIGWFVLGNATAASWLKLGIALLALAADHLCLITPAPWGHCHWHALASFAIDCLYADCFPFLHLF